VQWQAWWLERLPEARLCASTLTCLDASWAGSLNALLALASVWQEKAAPSQRLNLVWLADSMKDVDDRLAQACLPGWVRPAPFPGLHRQVLAHGAVTLLVGIGDRAQFTGELVCLADLVLVDSLESDVDDWLNPGGQALCVQTGQMRGQSSGLPSYNPIAQGWLGARQGGGATEALVIGGGICGLTTAANLARAGWSVTVLDAGGVHDGHLGAALTPVVSADDNSRSRLSRAGALAAARFWEALGDSIGAPCGALQLQRPAGERRLVDLKSVAERLNMPDWACWVDSHQASEIAGMRLGRGAMWFPGGWVVRVPDLLSRLRETPGVRCIQTTVSSVRHAGGVWHAQGLHGETIAHGAVAVVANAGDCLRLLEASDIPYGGTRLEGLHRLAGEVTAIPESALAGGPRCVVGGDGYVLPSISGWCVSGGTYQRGVDLAQCSIEGKVANLTRARELLGFSGFSDQIDPQTLQGWAGWRAVLPGRLPAIGPVPGQPGLWVFTGGASRGLTWSALGADLITGSLAGEPIALESALLKAVWPGF
jgi:tRNA 5-methylaminomethyl-2-thiouridine biosynthesis bifunctional protein